MSHKNLLLVEGRDEVEVIGNLLEFYQIPYADFRRTKFPQENSIIIKEKEGLIPLLQSLPLEINTVDLLRIGIILDADTDLPARWQSLRERLSRIGNIQMPLNPDQSGTIFQLSLERHEVRIGIWVMPDNQNQGALENFLLSFIPTTDTLLNRAKQAVADIPPNEKLFGENKLGKAEIHTWLAWQNDPGQPLWTPLVNNVLEPNAPPATQFIQWIQDVFEHYI